jgi:hypothetical protein
MDLEGVVLVIGWTDEDWELFVLALAILIVHFLEILILNSQHDPVKLRFERGSARKQDTSLAHHCSDDEISRVFSSILERHGLQKND